MKKTTNSQFKAAITLAILITILTTVGGQSEPTNSSNGQTGGTSDNKANKIQSVSTNEITKAWVSICGGTIEDYRDFRSKYPASSEAGIVTRALKGSLGQTYQVGIFWSARVFHIRKI